MMNSHFKCQLSALSWEGTETERLLSSHLGLDSLCHFCRFYRASLFNYQIENLNLLISISAQHELERVFREAE